MTLSPEAKVHPNRSTLRSPAGLIRRMSVENLLWDAPRIRGELLKLGFAVCGDGLVNRGQVHGQERWPRSRPLPPARVHTPGQSWGTFLRNHAPHIAAMD